MQKALVFSKSLPLFFASNFKKYRTITQKCKKIFHVLENKCLKKDESFNTD
jgi:hypothetical protein